MSSSVTRLFLIRHGETEWNTARIFQGHLNSNLTARGVRQAGELAQRLADEGIDLLYSSDQGRAMDTARVVANHLGLEVIPTAELREIDCGQWTGKSYQEVRVVWPEDFANWKNRPHLHCMPGGETVAQVQQRGLRFVERVRRAHPGKTICAVSHNTIVKSVLNGLQGVPLSQLWDGGRQVNCAINLIELDGDDARVIEVCGTGHLSEIGQGGISIV